METASASLTSDANLRSSEVSNMQAAEETLTQTARSLATQHAHADRFVADLMDRRTALQAQMSEAANKVKERQAAVEAFRGQVASQHMSIRVGWFFFIPLSLLLVSGRVEPASPSRLSPRPFSVTFNRIMVNQKGVAHVFS